jgi:molybdopterin molybdotransferase
MPAIDFDEALHTILSTVTPLSAENVAVAQALGRVTAATVFADEDAVPFPRSAMDGYAVRASECALATQDNPIELPVAGQVFAEKGESILAPATALAITTGSPIPSGADAVIPHERVARRGASIRIFAPVSPGDSVFPPGEDFHDGDELIAAGEILNPGKLALLAFAGKPSVCVFRRPRVALVCTGNELVDISAAPARGQVRNSNAVALSALVLAAGGEPRYEGVATDNHAVLAAMLERARRGADLLITTGGASEGERDLVKSVLTDLGAVLRFTHVAMRPGRPFGFAEWGGVPVCVLPGQSRGRVRVLPQASPTRTHAHLWKSRYRTPKTPCTARRRAARACRPSLLCPGPHPFRGRRLRRGAACESVFRAGAHGRRCECHRYRPGDVGAIERRTASRRNCRRGRVGLAQRIRIFMRNRSILCASFSCWPEPLSCLQPGPPRGAEELSPKEDRTQNEPLGSRVSR